MIIFRSTTILTCILTLCLCNAQDERSMQGAFGAVTIDGKVWNQIALRPIVPLGKFAVDKLRLLNGHYPNKNPKVGDLIKIVQ